MKKFSKGLFAFLAIAFVMGLSAMVVSAKEVALSPENFPDEEFRKQLDEDGLYRVRETKMVWDEDWEEWYEEEVYEEGEKYYDECDEEWYTEKIPVYKKDAAGNYIINYEDKSFGIRKGIDYTGIELFDDITKLDIQGGADVSKLPSDFASKITRLTLVGEGNEEIAGLSIFENVTELYIDNDYDISKIPDSLVSNISDIFWWYSKDLAAIDLSRFSNLKNFQLLSPDYEFNNKLTKLVLGKSIESVRISGYKKLSKLSIPKNSALKSLTITDSKVKNLDLKNCKNLKSLAIDDGVKQLKNIPGKTKNISICGYGKAKLNVAKLLGKGYKKTGKAKGSKYDAKKGTLEMSGWPSYISFAKGSKKIKLSFSEMG